MDAFYNIVELLLLLYYTSFVTWKIFAGHRFSTHFLGGQLVPFQLFLRDLKNKAVHLKFGSNVLCCLPQLQSLRSVLSKNPSETFWCRQPAALLKQTPSQDLPSDLCERFQNSYSVEQHWAISSLVTVAGSSYLHFRQLDLFCLYAFSIYYLD